jgi:hypothetical protein
LLEATASGRQIAGAAWFFPTMQLGEHAKD